MKASTDVQSPIPTKSRLALRGALPFFATFVLGTVVSAVVALFVYVNAGDLDARDGRFASIVVLGALLSALVAYVVARRTLETDPESNAASAFNLLEKYRRAAGQPGSDERTGHHSIGEQYLRELLGRRGR